MEDKYAAGISNQPVVIDNGSGVIKAGIAGEDIPKAIFSSYVGRPKHSKVMVGAVEGDSFIGSKAQELRGLLKLRYPIEHGIVSNWEDMALIWKYLYSIELKRPSEEHPVLLTESPLNPIGNREKSAQILFESMAVPGLFFSSQSTLSLYASGRTTGVVVDIGDGVSSVTPVYEGFALNHSVQRSDLGGREVTNALLLQLRKSGYRFVTSAEKEIVRSIKESACYVAPNPSQEEALFNVGSNGSASGSASSKSVSYRLPDGQTINLSQGRFRAPEILFDPSLIGYECNGIGTATHAAIARSDMDLRASLWENIVLAGGSTLFSGFGERLLAECKINTPTDMRIKISAPPERLYSAWMGGSILGSVGSFREMLITAAEYKEYGMSIIHRKSFA